MKLYYILTHTTYVIYILYYIYSISTYVLCSMFYCGNDGLLLLSFWDVCAKAKVTQRNSQRRQPSAEYSGLSIEENQLLPRTHVKDLLLLQ